MDTLQSIDLNLTERLKDQEFRREWFHAELETAVPEAFRELRELRGLTQGQLARACNTQQSAVSRFERSSSPVWEFEFLLRLADALDARLRLVVEPSENVLSDYSDDSQVNEGAVSAASAGNMGIEQDLKSSILNLDKLGKSRDESSFGRGVQGGISYKTEPQRPSAISA